MCAHLTSGFPKPQRESKTAAPLSRYSASRLLPDDTVIMKSADKTKSIFCFPKTDKETEQHDAVSATNVYLLSIIICKLNFKKT